jgi:hypothetical protein
MTSRFVRQRDAGWDLDRWRYGREAHSRLEERRSSIRRLDLQTQQDRFLIPIQDPAEYRPKVVFDHDGNLIGKSRETGRQSGECLLDQAANSSGETVIGRLDRAISLFLRHVSMSIEAWHPSTIAY